MPLTRTVRETISVPPGTYHVRCMNVREDRIEGSRNPNIIRFDMEIVDQVDASGNAVEIDAIASDRLTLKSKLYAWLSAFGLKLDLNADIDIEEVIGREALAQVVKKPDSEYTKVDNIIPLPAGGFRTGAAVAPPLQVIRADGSVNFIAFWKSLEQAGVTREMLADSLGVDMEGLTKHLASLSADDIVGLLADSGAGS